MQLTPKLHDAHTGSVRGEPAPWRPPEAPGSLGAGARRVRAGHDGALQAVQVEAVR